MTGPTTPAGEPLYTLEQARPLIVRERCEIEGHDLQCTMRQHNGRGRIVIEHWACAHGCDVRVILRYPDQKEAQ